MKASQITPLGALGNITVGYQLRRAVEPEVNGENPLIQLRNVRDGFLDLSDLSRMNLETDSKDGKPLARVQTGQRVQPGDVLLRSRGATYGAALAGDDVPPRAVALAPLFVLRLQSNVLPPYLIWFINRAETQAALKVQEGGTHIPSVSVQAFRELLIVVPSLDIQNRIVEIDRLAKQEREIMANLQAKRDRQVTAHLEELLDKIT